MAAAIGFDDKNPLYLARRGDCQLELGRFAGAIRDHDKAIKLDDQNAARHATAFGAVVRR